MARAQVVLHSGECPACNLRMTVELRKDRPQNTQRFECLECYLSFTVCVGPYGHDCNHFVSADIKDSDYCPRCGYPVPKNYTMAQRLKYGTPTGGLV